MWFNKNWRRMTIWAIPVTKKLTQITVVKTKITEEFYKWLAALRNQTQDIQFCLWMSAFPSFELLTKISERLVRGVLRHSYFIILYV